MATKKAAKPKGPSSGKKLLASDPHLTDQERQVLEAVWQFEIAEKTIQIFEEDPKHKAIMSQYKELLEERDQKLQAADQLVRGLDVSCGPWDRYSESTKYLPTVMYQHLGKAKFLEFGGKISTETIYSVDKGRVEIAIAKGDIDADTAKAIKTVTPSYHTPKLKL